MITPLTAISEKNSTFKWTATEQKAFDDIKTKIATNAVLKYPDFNKPFVIHTDSSDFQLGGVIMQEGHPLAFFSRKLNPAQKNYTVTGKEL